MMEPFALYLIKSVTWLTGFFLVYIIFLRNERFFVLNRIFLISGILASLLLPFLTLRYTVLLTASGSAEAGDVVAAGVKSSSGFITGANVGLLLIFIYLAGIMFILFMIIKQCRPAIRVIREKGLTSSSPVKLIKTDEYPTSFSFFSYVFVNPSVPDIEIKEILNHEVVHIRQKHWLDLILVELLCLIQWFNPLVWIYIRLVRQNHEYIADEVALQRTSDPAVYRAALLNQIVGSPVISLGNSFNYSLNKKRFKMMKNIISSPYRKMKIFFILPVFAFVFYAFAKPEYRYVAPAKAGNDLTNVTSDKSVRGSVSRSDGKPLEGAMVVLKGTNVGTACDSKGAFSLSDVPGDALLVVSHIGYKSKVLKPDFSSAMIITMVQDTVKFLNDNIGTPPPEPATPNQLKIRDANGENPPLVVVDGVVSDIDVNAIDPGDVESIKVLKDEFATEKYGDKGKYGVVEVTTKNPSSQSSQSKNGPGKYVAVEEMPEFPGGGPAMISWINSNIKYPGEAVSRKITGKVYVDFMVSSTGKVKDVKVNKPVNPLLDAEAVRVISAMPDWKPGMQNGKPVDVQMLVPVEFKLK